MIFDDFKQPAGSGSPRKRVRRRRASGGSAREGFGSSHRNGTFEKAVRLHEPVRGTDEHGNIVWLWVLGILIVAAAGFAFYLHNARSAPRMLSGEAPTARLTPFVDPILAPLPAGAAGYDVEALDALASQFRQERENAGRDDAEIYAAAASITGFLREALIDRDRHLQRLEDLGPGHNPAERKHLELAVDVSWQRNSTAHRDSIEQAWTRLRQLEQGRFRTEADAAPAGL